MTNPDPTLKRRMRSKSIKTAATDLQIAKVSASGKVGGFRQLAKRPMKGCATESQEQIAVIDWCNMHPIAWRIFAVPNGAYKSIASAAKFKREGLRAGIPDLFLDVSRDSWHGLRIELKRTRGGTVSPEQKDWGKFYAEQGYYWCVCKGADEAIKVIKEYLEL